MKKEKQILKEMIAWIERRLKETPTSSYYIRMKSELEKDLAKLQC